MDPGESVNAISGKEFAFVWRIENFNYCWYKIGEDIKSQITVADTLDGTSWRLHVFPRGKDVNPYHSIDCELVPCDGRPHSFDISVEISILNVDGTLEMTQRKHDITWGKNTVLSFEQLVLRDVVLKEKKASFLPNDTLSLYCRIWKSGETVPVTMPPVHCLVRSHFQLRRTTVEYTLNNIHKLHPFERRVFPVLPAWENYPSVELEFVLDRSSNGDHQVRMVITLSDYRPDFNVCTCKIDVLNAGRRRIASIEEEHWFTNPRGKQVWKLPGFITKNQLLEAKKPFSRLGEIIVRCECAISLTSDLTDVEYMSAPCLLADIARTTEP